MDELDIPYNIARVNCLACALAEDEANTSGTDFRNKVAAMPAIKT